MNINLKTNVASALKGWWGTQDIRIMEIDLSDNYVSNAILTHADTFFLSK
jgi:hypothetical protein